MRTALLALALVGSPAHAQGPVYLVVVSGLGGEPKYSDAFYDTAITLLGAAGDRLGIPSDQVVYLAEQPQRDTVRITGRSTKDGISRVLRDLAARAEADALIVIVLIGHGSAVGGASRINLPGPDLTADAFDVLLDRFPTQRIVVANTTSASGGWLETLSAPRRTIITATRSGGERYESYFGRHFADAFAADGADTDKNGRTSVLEAFLYARREVARTYEGDNRFLTEHALLDDDGDGEGSREPQAESGDGAIAARLFLDRPAAVLDSDPELALLQQHQDSLQRELAALRARKDALPAIEYDRALERLLLEIARTGRAMRERRPERRP